MSVSVHAQDTLAVSDRVGKVIDSTERTYFRLFPDVEGAAGIVLRRAQVAGVRVDADGEAVMDIDFDQLGLLQEYIDRYDSLMAENNASYVARDLNHRFRSLVETRVIAEIEPWEGADIKVTASAGYGKALSLRGELLWADNHRLIIRPESSLKSVTPVAVAAADITSISSFDHDPGRGALVGLGVGAGVGLALGLVVAAGVEDRDRDSGLQFAVVSMLVIMGAAAFTVLGTFIGLISTYEEKVEVDIPYQYLSMLPSLQKVMYYRFGLPPDSPWREK